MPSSPEKYRSKGEQLEEYISSLDDNKLDQSIQRLLSESSIDGIIGFAGAFLELREINQKRVLGLLVRRLEALADFVVSRQQKDAIDLNSEGENILHMVSQLTEHETFESVLSKSEHGENTIQQLLRIIRAHKGFDNEFNIRFRALMALNSMDYKPEDKRFWIKQYESGGPEYAVVVVEGLGRSSLDLLFEWLQVSVNEKEVLEALMTMIPGLIERNGRQVIKEKLRKLKPSLKEEQFRDLEYFLKDKSYN